MNEEYDIDWSARFGFGGPRPTSRVTRIVIHTTENDAVTPAENVAQYQLNSETGSYHTLVDSRGVALRCNTADWTTWSTGNNQGNREGMNLSFVARAAWSRDQWLAQDDMLRRGARVVRKWAADFGIPLVKTDGTRPGLCGHGDLRRYGGTDHTDPGTGFPWDTFITYCKGNNVPNPDPRHPADLTLEQLVGVPADQYPGWVQLGDRTLVDAVASIGAHLGIDGFKEVWKP